MPKSLRTRKSLVASDSLAIPRFFPPKPGDFANGNPFRVVKTTQASDWFSADMHYWLELGIVLDGRVERRAGASRSVLERGEVWLNGVWEPHSGAVVSRRATYVMITMLPQTLKMLSQPGQEGIDWLALFMAPPQERPKIPPRHREEVACIAERVAALRAATSASKRAWIPLRVTELLLKVMESWRRRPAATDTRALPHPALREAMNLIFSLKVRVSIQEAALACKVSVDTVERSFLAVTGMNFSEFGRRRRIAGAAEQLISTTDSVKKIAGEWGFRCSSHLDALFREYYGCSPTEHRSRHKLKPSTFPPIPPQQQPPPV